MFLFGPPNIEKMKEKKDIRSLISAVDYKNDANIRRKAVIALAEVDKAAAVQKLPTAISDPDMQVSLAAAKVMASLAPEKACDVIVERLRDVTSAWDVSESYVGELASILVFHMASTKVVSLLEPLIRNEHTFSKNALLRVIIPIDDPEVLGILVKEIQKKPINTSVLQEGLVTISRKRQDEVIRLLDNGDYLVRKMAATALQGTGWQPATDATEVKFWFALGEWDKCVAVGQPAVDILISFLTDPNTELRKQAAETLVKMGGWVVPILAHRCVAASPENKMGVNKRSPEFETLEMFGVQSITPLKEMLTSPFQNVRWTGAILLQEMNWRPPEDFEGEFYYKLGLGYDYQLARWGIAVVRKLFEDIDQFGKDIQIYTRDISAVKKLAYLADKEDPNLIMLEIHRLYIQARDQGDDERKKICMAYMLSANLPGVQPLLIEYLNQLPRRKGWLTADMIDWLDTIQWEPDATDLGAAYLIAKGRLEECGRLGEMAVEPLLTVLYSADHNARVTAAKSLVTIYQTSPLREDQRQAILSAREWITQPHVDQQHVDGNNRYKYVSSDCTHEDIAHIDSGIGEFFPL